MPRLNPLLQSLSTYPIVELERRKAAAIDAGIRVFDFGTGDPSDPTPEFIRQSLLRAVTPRCPYPKVAGRPPIRRAIADYLERRFGVTVDPDTQVIPTAGSKEAVFHAPLLVIDPSAEDRLVAFPDPGYPAYQRGVLFCGGEPYPVILDGTDHVFRPWELPEEVLRKTRMIWINNPHNPSGAIASLDELRRCVEVCQEYDILLMSDETYADIYQEERPHSVLEAGMKNVVALHSLSKRSGMTGYRSGFLAGDPEMIGRLKGLRANPGLVPQDFVNAAAIAAWGDDTHVARRREIFQQKKELFTAFFSEVGIELVGSQATIYLWLKVPDGLSDEEYCHKLLEHGIVLCPGRMFGVAGGGAGYARLALVPSIEECAEAVEVWRALC
jgi:LL-diaminopimelate aminotransferase